MKAPEEVLRQLDAICCVQVAFPERTAEHDAIIYTRVRGLKSKRGGRRMRLTLTDPLDEAQPRCYPSQALGWTLEGRT